MRQTTTIALTAAAFLALASAAPILAQDHMGHHGAVQERPAGMMHQMMQDCAMMGAMMGGMMGPEALLEHAEELDLTAEQVTELELLQGQLTEARLEMRRVMHSMHEVLTPEQRELMHDGHGDRMGGMMIRDMRDMHDMMRGMGAMHRMMHGMMHSGDMDCPMMGTGRTDRDGHSHPPGGG